MALESFTTEHLGPLSGTKPIGPQTLPAALATTAATTSTPYGFSQAQADGLIAAYNAIRTVLIAQGIGK